MSEDTPGLLDDVLELPTRAVALGRAAGGTAVVSGLALVPAAVIVLVIGQAATWIALRPAHHGGDVAKATRLALAWFMTLTVAAALALLESGPLAAFTLAAGRVQVGIGRALSVGLSRWPRLALLDFLTFCPVALMGTLHDVLIPQSPLPEWAVVATVVGAVAATAFVYVRWTNLAAPLIVGWTKPSVREAIVEAHALGRGHRLLLIASAVTPWLVAVAARPSGLLAAQLSRRERLLIEGTVIVVGLVIALVLRPLLAVAALDIARARAGPAVAPESSA